MKILLLEDDRNIVEWVAQGGECESALSTTKFEILLLDLNLPDQSGIEILKKI